MLRKMPDAVWFQGIILLSLSLVAPYAMSFTPYEKIYSDGIWNTPFHLDPLFPVRVVLIVAGWLGGILSLILCLREWLNKHRSKSDKVFLMSMALCSLSIGWAAFPYWVNGMFQAYLGNAAISDFDPKALIPTTWLGGIWYFGTLAIYLCACFIAPVLLMANFKLRQQQPELRTALTTLCLLVSAAIFFLSPNYVRWLAD